MILGGFTCLIEKILDAANFELEISRFDSNRKIKFGNIPSSYFLYIRLNVDSTVM